MDIDFYVNAIKSYKKHTDSYSKYFYGFSGDFNDFIDLSHISYTDKLHVAVDVLNTNQLVRWAILCAESVLYVYENKRPNDSRVRDCINYLKTISDFSNLSGQQKRELRKHGDASADASNGTLVACTNAYWAACTVYGAAYYAANFAGDIFYPIGSSVHATGVEKQIPLNLQFLKIASGL